MKQMNETCECNCGYICGGPGRCALWKKDGLEGMQECIEKHFKRDCTHDFDGELVNVRGGLSTICKKCGMSSMSHDERTGP
jgi:hypothetical protein